MVGHQVLAAGIQEVEPSRGVERLEGGLGQEDPIRDGGQAPLVVDLLEADGDLSRRRPRQEAACAAVIEHRHRAHHQGGLTVIADLDLQLLAAGVDGHLGVRVPLLPGGCGQVLAGHGEIVLGADPGLHETGHHLFRCGVRRGRQRPHIGGAGLSPAVQGAGVDRGLDRDAGAGGAQPQHGGGAGHAQHVTTDGSHRHLLGYGPLGRSPG